MGLATARCMVHRDWQYLRVSPLSEGKLDVCVPTHGAWTLLLVGQGRLEVEQQFGTMGQGYRETCDRDLGLDAGR